ncbi:kinesin-like protein KIN-12E [Durio zibethinus]|uniref:Kinesin-like protein KIN-12E n=1 Tax=Durio zibethinus TaxID=66656 RepID=A0A6P5XWG0_DURZI|nr:kinesin-like protein KIN-12E [Durio zibethinus]XP_022732378.1 kinesin-like protein KIN-12E [Durio zibethinus]
MPFISDTASAIKSRFGFHDRSSSSDSVSLSARSPPDLLVKSAVRENAGHSTAATSAIRSIGDWDNDSTENNESAPQSSQSFEFREDPSFWKDHNVQVIIRIRPLSSSEISLQGYSKCVRQESCQTITWTGHPESRFTFDLVADEHVSQENLFKVAGLPMVDNCMGGYNSCMFAYGQTGSGKTHTMLGDIEGGTRRHSVNCGMTPRVFEYLFTRIQKEKDTRKEEKLRFTCKCSFLEIYNEQILDLLDPSSTNLQIREDIKKGVYVENLKEIEVTSARDVIQQLIQGAASRKVAATNMNRASSRSHSVFTCIIESKWDSQGVTHHRFARLNLVDLAGSERQKSSGAEGERLKEATNINKSLSTLGLVIMNLVNISNGKSLHVPYRDSKLTFLLQDSLGGNSKTTIIANISPSNCCSLETLSTLKFAQRAKFIKNNAVVNEDASGDVVAMRLQIQQLKKEVSRLQGFVDGRSENLENDMLALSFPASPGPFKWEGLHGSFSPLTADKRMSQKKDYEVALVGAFKREREKEAALQALTAETQAAMQLAKQREDEIQSLKMRLRFRESGIKRLEAVASGKISAETHLLKEKEEYLKEIEVLRAQVDRNQEVTRFAMENLRLKEEIRRLKSLCDEGQQEMMNEQIKVLHNKLLEALDWKLMHESDSLAIEKNSKVVSGLTDDGNQLISRQEQDSTWCSSLKEENEFLRMQAIHNKAEMDALQKKLEFCLEEKEELERYVSDLLKKLEEERSSRPEKEDIQQTELSSLSVDVPMVKLNDQMELKTMVDTIAAASQREAEALEKAFKLSQENDELRLKLKGCVEDNKQLLELYEQKVAETNYKSLNEGDTTHENDITDHTDAGLDEHGEETQVQLKKVVDNLEQQLTEMHEENEKLMGLYERAMQERDEFKRMFSSGALIRGEAREFECPEKLVEVDGGEDSLDKPQVQFEAKDLEGETGLLGSNMQDAGESLKLNRLGAIEVISDLEVHADLQSEAGNQIDDTTTSYMKIDQLDTTTAKLSEYLNSTTAKLSEYLNSARAILERAQEKLSDSAKTITEFGSLERAFCEIDQLSREIEVMEGRIKEKQQHLESVALLSSETKEKKALTDNKLSALKHSVSSFSSSVAYIEQREDRARTRLNASLSYLDKKKEELAHLKKSKGEIEASLGKMRESEAEARSNIVLLKSKLEEESRRHENDKVLFAIDNLDKVDSSQRTLCLGGKATELLKTEVEKSKLQNEIKLSRESLATIKMRLQDLNKKLVKVENDMEAVILEVQKGSKSVEELELALEGVIQEKETLVEIGENGKTEIGNLILEYQQHMFNIDLTDAEMKVMDAELQLDLGRLEQLQTLRATTAKKVKELAYSGFLSEKLEADIQSVRATFEEAKTLLGLDH